MALRHGTSDTQVWASISASRAVRFASIATSESTSAAHGAIHRSPIESIAGSARNIDRHQRQHVVQCCLVRVVLTLLVILEVCGHVGNVGRCVELRQARLYMSEGTD